MNGNYSVPLGLTIVACDERKNQKVYLLPESQRVDSQVMMTK